MNLTPYFTPYATFILRWRIDPMVKAKTVKFLKENTGRYLCDLGKGEEFIGHGKQ